MSTPTARRAAAGPLPRLCIGSIALALLGGCAGTPQPVGAPLPPAGAPYRIYDAEGRPVAGIGALVRGLREAQVVFVGEQHDDAIGHRFELELLQALSREGRPVVVGLEMFERDVQPALDAYLAGTLSESAFLESARPWPNYPTDYRPLVEWARAQGWPVVASNVPQPLASAVAQGGLESLPAGRLQGLAAEERVCPEDAYFERFAREMRQHPAPPGSSQEARMAGMIPRFYQAQCLKDETMAESIVAARRGDRLVVHFHGAFHSDFGYGIASRVRRRDPGVRAVVISMIPAPDVDDAATVARYRERADYLVLTHRPASGG